MLTAVIGRPAKLIRRFPNRLIRMGADYLLYDFRLRDGPEVNRFTNYERPGLSHPARHAAKIMLRSIPMPQNTIASTCRTMRPMYGRERISR